MLFFFQLSVVHKVLGADGQMELKNDIVKLTVGSDKEELQGSSATARRQLLKDSLRRSMSAKKMADRMKKTSEQVDDDEDIENGIYFSPFH